MNYSLASRIAACLLLVGILAACGGGSSDTAAVATAPTSFTVAGTAATGAPFAGATVSLKDSLGAPFTASALTGADGSYSITVLLSAKPPFVVQAVSADKTMTLVSVVAEAKDTNTNITPITNLIASRLSTSGDPANLAAELKANPALFDAAALKIKVAEIVALIKPLMDAAGDSSDPLNGKLVADGTSTADKVLDSLTISITPTSAVSVDIVVTVKPQGTDTAGATAITFTGGGTNAPVVATVTVPNGTPSVPADVALKPAASNCSALHSGTYRFVEPNSAATTLASQYGKMTINAETLATINPDGSTDVWSANGTCRYTGNAGKNDIVVSQAGVIVARYTNDGSTFNLAIGFPDQAHTQAELAGNWNGLGIENTGTTTPAYTGTALSATIDAAGAMTAVKFCQNTATWDVSVCSDIPNGQLAMTANADGGYDIVDNGKAAGRVFGYRAGGGELMLVAIDGDGSFELLTKQRTNILPTVGVVTSNWNLVLNNLLKSAGAVSATTNTIASTDATAGSWVRTQKTVGGTDDHAETLFANTPRNGLTFRVGGTATAADGKTVTIREFTNLGMRGMGFSPLLLPAIKTFMLSVTQP